MIRAYRFWRVENDELWNWNWLVGRIKWTPDTPPAVHTHSGVHHKGKEEDVPAEHCCCGYYAMKRLDWLFREVGDPLWPISVCGEVLLWGKIIEGEEGYKAQLARPSALFTFNNFNPSQSYNEKVTALAKKLDLPVIAVSYPKLAFREV